MKIESITIKNFKSIKELTIPFKSYGEGIHASNTAILIGLNESGKSSILEAIAVADAGFYQMPYDNVLFKGVADNNIYIEIIYSYTSVDQNQIKEKMADKFAIPKHLMSKIHIKNINYQMWLTQDEEGGFFDPVIVKDKAFDSSYPLFKPVQTLTERILNVDGEIQGNGMNTNESDTDLSSTPSINQLQKFVEEEMDDFLLNKLPDIIVWKPLPKFLITEPINLNNFKENSNISIPLKNIFLSAGFTTGDEIKKIIEKAQKNPDTHAELIDKLSISITKQLTSIWIEHKINLKITINGDLCNVHVEDNDRKHKYFNMSQRSEGFKQFVSLILTLSTTNSRKTLENKIIILDEPEIHLHPSGVRYMRDELLKIGKNNYVIIATHSHYMIDTTTPERHFIVSKQKMETKIEQVGKNTSMLDNEVLAKAFGINLFKELLPSNILFVEGGDDKTILSHGLKLSEKNLSYSITSAGGAPKVYGSLSILVHDHVDGVKVFALFDDDKEGRDAKNDILKRLKDYYTTENIKTIRDLVSSLPKDATVEDLLPIEFVKVFFENEMSQKFVFEKDKALIKQIKEQCQTLRENKSQLEAKKVKLSKEFIEKFNTKEQLENEVPLLIELANNLILAMQQ